MVTSKLKLLMPLSMLEETVSVMVAWMLWLGCRVSPCLFQETVIHC